MTVKELEMILPSLIKAHGNGKPLIKAINGMLKQGDEVVPIVNENGEPVLIEEIILVGAPSEAEIEELEEEAGEPAQEPASTPAIQAAIKKAVAEAFKSATTKAALNISGGAPASEKDEERFGFKSMGEQLMCVVTACGGGGVDQRLYKGFTGDKAMLKQPTTVSNTGVGAEGGFTIAPMFVSEIREITEAEESLLSRVNIMPVTGNSITVPADENTDWDTVRGIQAKATAENAKKTQSKIDLKQLNLRLKKIVSLVPVTDELLDDNATALATYVSRKAGRKIDFESGEWIVRGTGAGEALGFLNSPALVSVAKEGGQATDTIVYNNIIKMWSRMYGPNRSRGIWLINQDIEPQLFQLSFEGTSSSVPAYLPANGLSDSPFGSLFGRPVVPTQHAETLGDKGDIMFVDLDAYLVIQKEGGIQAAESMHVWFDFDTTAFRFVMRMDGQPWWTAPITPRKGTATLSPFVTLDARA